MTSIASAKPDVGQARGGHQVADGPDARLARLHQLVDLDEAALVDFHTTAGRDQVVAQRPAPDGHDDGLDLEDLGTTSLATVGFELDGRQLAVRARACACRRSRPVRMSMPRRLNDRTTTSATSLSTPGRIFGRASRMVTCTPMSDSIEANSQPMAPPPITTADSGSCSRSSTSSLVMHEPAVDLETGDGPGHRTGGQDDCRRLQLGMVPSSPSTRTFRPGSNWPGADEGHHLAALQQSLQAVVQLVDHLVLADLGGGEIDGPAIDPDPVLARPLDGPVDGGRLQQFLGRDAATVQAGAADLFLFDQGDAQAGQAAVKGGRVTARTSPDNHDIKRFGRRYHHLSHSQITLRSRHPAQTPSPGGG